MKTNLGQIANIEKERKFFDFWKETPIVNMLSDKKFREVFSANIREFIIDILAVGVKDKYPESDETMYRHALSGKEILKLIAEKYKINVNKSNFYFHLNVLLDQGLIRIVDSINVGMRQTSYFGRTAKIFIVGEKGENKFHHDIIENPILIDIIKTISPRASEEKINETLNKLKPLNDNRGHDEFTEWAKENQKLILDLDIDFRELSRAFNLMFRYNMKVADGLYHLAKLLKFNYDEHMDTIKFEQSIDSLKFYHEDRLLTEDDLFAFWKHVPFIKVFQNDEHEQIFSFSNEKQRNGARIREAIIHLLRKGLEKTTSLGDSKRRYALSVKEILDSLNEEIATIENYFANPDGSLDLKYFIDTSITNKIKKSNLYFHLQKLQEIGYIMDIGSIKKGKRFTTYYGRPAKVFSTVNYSGKKPYPIFDRPEFKSLVQRISSKFDEYKFEGYLKEIARINDYNFYCYPSWIKSIENDIKDIPDIDDVLIKLTNLVAVINRFRYETCIALTQLGGLLRLKQSDY